MGDNTNKTIAAPEDQSAFESEYSILNYDRKDAARPFIHLTRDNLESGHPNISMQNTFFPANSLIQNG